MADCGFLCDGRGFGGLDVARVGCWRFVMCACR